LALVWPESGGFAAQPLLLTTEGDGRFGPERGGECQFVNKEFPNRAQIVPQTTEAIVLDFANALWQRKDMLEEVGQRRRATGRRFFVSLVRGA
jgi:hypothetical protein